MSRFAACWKDEALKARFTSDPGPVQAARGIGAPDGLDVRVVDNSDRMTHLTIPMSPEFHKGRSSDEGLAQAAAGVAVYVGGDIDRLVPKSWRPRCSILVASAPS